MLKLFEIFHDHKMLSGMYGFFHSYTPNFSNWSLHLHSLLRKETEFRWTSAHESEFRHLEESLTSNDLRMLHPNWNQEQMHHNLDVARCLLGITKEN